jgi:hypothetical protein
MAGSSLKKNKKIRFSKIIPSYVGKNLGMLTLQLLGENHSVCM